MAQDTKVGVRVPQLCSNFRGICFHFFSSIAIIYRRKNQTENYATIDSHFLEIKLVQLVVSFPPVEARVRAPRGAGLGFRAIDSF